MFCRCGAQRIGCIHDRERGMTRVAHSLQNSRHIRRGTRLRNPNAQTAGISDPRMKLRENRRRDQHRWNLPVHFDQIPKIQCRIVRTPSRCERHELVLRWLNPFAQFFKISLRVPSQQRRLLADLALHSAAEAHDRYTRTSIRCTPTFALLKSMFTRTKRAPVGSKLCLTPNNVAGVVLLLISATRFQCVPSVDTSTVYW